MSQIGLPLRRVDLTILVVLAIQLLQVNLVVLGRRVVQGDQNFLCCQSVLRYPVFQDYLEVPVNLLDQ